MGGAVEDLPFVGVGDRCRLALPGEVTPRSDRLGPGPARDGGRDGRSADPGGCTSLLFPLSASFSFSFFLSGVSSSDSSESC